MKKSFLLFLAFLFGTFATSASAQVDFEVASTLGQPEFEISLEPEYPQPEKETTAVLSGFLTGSQITWFIDGQEVPDSKNKRELKFISSKVGQEQTITARVESLARGNETPTITYTPLYIDIIIEAQTHVPNFYLGRALPSFGSVVNATAIVSGESIYDTDLVYQWRAGSEVIGGGPLRGFNKVSFEANRDRNILITLQVSSPEGEAIAERLVFIPSVMPFIKFYEASSLLGLSQTVVSDPFSLSGSNVTLQAEPYHLDSRVFNEPDIAEWSIGDREYTNNNNNPYQATLKPTGEGGWSQLEFHVRDTERLLQGARAELNINI